MRDHALDNMVLKDYKSPKNHKNKNYVRNLCLR